MRKDNSSMYSGGEKSRYNPKVYTIYLKKNDGKTTAFRKDCKFSPPTQIKHLGSEYRLDCFDPAENKAFYLEGLIYEE